MTPRIVGWRIYYDDGQTWDAARGAWHEAPDDGVLVVKVWEANERGEVGTRIFYGLNFYFSDGNQLFGANNDGEDELPGRYPTCRIKRGRWTSPGRYAQMLNASLRDHEVPNAEKAQSEEG